MENRSTKDIKIRCLEMKAKYLEDVLEKIENNEEDTLKIKQHIFMIKSQIDQLFK